MIEELEIRDLGVIAHSVLPLQPGFTAITGETGAGKTMVVAALTQLMGARSDAAMVRRGAERSRITGIVRTENAAVHELVDEVGGEVTDGELILGRTVSAEGRSRATVGGSAAPAAALARIAPHLFALHGQSDQLRLQSAAAQRDMLDRFGGAALLRVREEHSKVFQRRAECEQRREALLGDQRERLREAERLRGELEEIRAAEPREGEDEELLARIERLGNVEALRTAADTARFALSASGDDPFAQDLATLLGQALQALEVEKSDPEIARIHAMLASVQVQIGEAASELGALSNSLDEEGPEELARASARLEVLHGLARKYGASMSEIIAYADEAEERLAELGSDDLTIEQLGEELERLSSEEDQLATELTSLRQAAASDLGERVSRELRQLALPDAEVKVGLEAATPSPLGRDEALLMLAPHQGSDFRPIHKGASGGELSRIMLALEVTIAEVDPVPTFVFDEVDAGVGGQAAIEIGRRLRRLAETSQVIVVTHLAQVAAFAHHHLGVTKDSAGGFTESSCRPLEGESRLHEMARLLSGMSDSSSALDHAAELLALGNE
ncbi:DNA repair protein RecN [Leucobacter sp. UCMA 4100]|uniref:DNA repair protein RecN n=1 Tax=Leucobacter sp. UCMA 4100 TaxID=2810534 RepID=UPI0022EA8B22|nr:DNA repair protein RecN [Leucobacter sp. UCMA 4100]MDA3147573.1 DNA repair protein RecN [Leucobacter sp. UCMA 4100]